MGTLLDLFYKSFFEIQLFLVTINSSMKILVYIV